MVISSRHESATAFFSCFSWTVLGFEETTAAGWCPPIWQPRVHLAVDHFYIFPSRISATNEHSKVKHGSPSLWHITEINSGINYLRRFTVLQHFPDHDAKSDDQFNSEATQSMEKDTLYAFIYVYTHIYIFYNQIMSLIII